MNSSIVSTAILAATSPAAWPPIPSATTKSPSPMSMTNESSLWRRFRPTSVRPAARREKVIASSCTGRAMGLRLLEPMAQIRGVRVPAHGLTVTFFRTRPKAGLAEDQAGILQELRVPGIELQGFLHGRDGEAQLLRKAQRRHRQVVVDLSVARILPDRHLEIRPGGVPPLVAVGLDALLGVSKRNRLPVVLPDDLAVEVHVVRRSRVRVRQHVVGERELLELIFRLDLLLRRKLVGMPRAGHLPELFPDFVERGGARHPEHRV